VGSTRTDGARCNDSKDGGEDEGNKEEESDEWGEKDGKEEKEDEKQRKEDEPSEEERKSVTVSIKNLFQPPSDKIPNCSAPPVAETLEGCDDASGKETATL